MTPCFVKLVAHHWNGSRALSATVKVFFAIQTMVIGWNVLPVRVKRAGGRAAMTMRASLEVTSDTMRLSDLERWLIRMGWQPEPLKSGSHRFWTHPMYPGQRMHYSAPHDGGRSSGELRPDVVIAIYQRLITMRPADEQHEHEQAS